MGRKHICPPVVAVILAAAALLAVRRPSVALTASDCLACHSDSSLTMNGPNGKKISVVVDPATFQKSIHGSLDCTDCHGDVTEIPHPEALKEVDCGTCHPEVKQKYLSGIHAKAARAGDPDAPRCRTCHGTHDILPASDPNSSVSPLNQPATCGTCHGNESFAQRHHLPAGLPSKEYENSVHAQALKKGIRRAPTCSNCHRAHSIQPASDHTSPISRRNVEYTCGLCHRATAKTYEGSIHGTAIQQGLASAPTCINCHGEHSILSPTRKEASTNPTRVSQMVCEPCHSSVVLNQSYGLPTTQVSSYFNSYHGLAILRGSTVAANCTSCHGVHNIYATYDPRSTVNAANLQKTCGRCHPGARASFAQTPVHAARRKELKAVTFIRDAYIILIIVTISGMFIHNMIIYLSFVVAKRRKYRIEPTVDRFNLNMIVQHAILFVCFITLVITGFALKFPGVFTVLGSLGIDEHRRAVIHRIAASGLVAAGLYHLYWILFARRGKVEFRQMLPRMQDFRDFLASMRYYLRLSSQRPRYDRYSYVEKVEYWALIWGTTIMAITGFILWFPVRTTDLLGPWVTPIATTIHFYEALLATLAIVVWHFFFTIFHPEEYPMSTVWIDGKATVEEIKTHRPAWFRRMNEEGEKKKEGKRDANEEKDAGQPDQNR